MSQLTIDITPEEEARLRAAAEQEGRDVLELARAIFGEALQNRCASPTGTKDVSGGRIFDMHPGAMVMSDDFDAPLPDSFWLGEE